MQKEIFTSLENIELSDAQRKSAQNILSSEKLYYAENVKSADIEKFKNGLIKIGTMQLKDNTTYFDMLIEKKSNRRVILMRANSKEFFIVSSLWQDVSSIWYDLLSVI